MTVQKRREVCQAIQRMVDEDGNVTASKFLGYLNGRPKSVMYEHIHRDKRVQDQVDDLMEKAVMQKVEAWEAALRKARYKDTMAEMDDNSPAKTS